MGKSARARSTLRSGGGSYEVYLEDLSTYQYMLEEIGFRIENIEIIGSEGSFVRDSKGTSFDREFIVLVALKE